MLLVTSNSLKLSDVIKLKTFIIIALQIRPNNDL